MCNLSAIFCENRFSSFCAILLTNKQTNPRKHNLLVGGGNNVKLRSLHWLGYVDNNIGALFTPRHHQAQPCIPSQTAGNSLVARCLAGKRRLRQCPTPPSLYDQFLLPRYSQNRPPTGRPAGHGDPTDRRPRGTACVRPAWPDHVTNRQRMM